jgi:topoisomerase IV subunit A
VLYRRGLPRYHRGMSDNLTDESEAVTGEVAEPLRRAIGERYLQYALSTIMHRALPDARDGLKPVHRRILFAMRELKLASNGGFRKSAKISGDVMGNYHPHGDAAIYDAMARLAQDFAVRYPLVDGQGNFGNIDGDNPAAARYTEARMTVVLPAAFPNLLANGSTGIAVGMATNIPPHNISELIDACLHMVKTPEVRDETLLNYVQGPDFPTGGIIVEPREMMAKAYASGRGSFRLRAKYEIEDLGRGQWQVVVTEIPYQVPKSRLIEKIAELIQNKKIPILGDVRDESAEDIRLVLEPKSKNVDPDMLMSMMFRYSDLEVRFSMNMNVLIDGRTPKVCSLKAVLRAFLDHRREVLQRRSNHRLQKIDHRLEVLKGYIIAFLNLDRIIEIIRNEDDPKAVMMAEDWGGAVFLSDVQAEAILNMRLRSLRRLEEMELTREHDALLQEREGLLELLGSDALQWDRICEELRQTRKDFGKDYAGGARRSQFADAVEVEEVPLEAMIEREPVTVVCSKMGWIRAMKGHIALDGALKFKDGDESMYVFHAETTDKLLLLGSNGRFYTILTANLPGGRGMGEPVRLIVDLPNEVEIISLFIHDPAGKRLLASTAGDGFIVAETELLAQTRSGKQALNVRGEVRALVCTKVAGNHVACVGENRKVLVFPIEELPELGRGKGVRLQKYKDGGLSDARTFDLELGLNWRDPAGRTRTVSEGELAEWLGKRAGTGRMAPRGFPRDNRFN